MTLFSFNKDPIHYFYVVPKRSYCTEYGTLGQTRHTILPVPESFISAQAARLRSPNASECECLRGGRRENRLHNATVQQKERRKERKLKNWKEGDEGEREKHRERKKETASVLCLSVCHCACCLHCSWLWCGVAARLC